MITKYNTLILEIQLNNYKLFKSIELVISYQKNELSPEELLDIMNYINRIIKHIANGNEYEERMVSIMGGTVEETPSQKLKRLEDERIILNLFSNGVGFEPIRKSVSEDVISNERLLELQKLAAPK